MDKTVLKDAGFAPIRRSPRRMIASIQGPIKSGKTKLSLTGKKPTGFISIEIGGNEGVIDQFIPDGADQTESIQIVQIRMDNPVYPDRAAYKDDKAYDAAVHEAIQTVADVALQKFYAAYYASLENFEVTVVDTGSDLWELIRLANFGRLEKIPQLAYGQINKIMDKLLDDAYSFSGSVFFLHHMKEKWEQFVDDKGKTQGRPSGIFEMEGYKGIKKKVQVVVELWREDLTEPNLETGRMVRFNCIINDSRQNPDAMGKILTDDSITIPMLGVELITGSKEADWL